MWSIGSLCVLVWLCRVCVDRVCLLMFVCVFDGWLVGWLVDERCWLLVYCLLVWFGCVLVVVLVVVFVSLLVLFGWL